MFCHTSILDVEVNLEMPRKQSEAILVRYGPVPHNDYEVGRLTMEELRRLFAELGKRFDRGTGHFDHERFGDTEETGKTNNLLSGLQHGALQSHVAMETDVKTDKKTRKRTEGAAAADRAKHEDSPSGKVDDGPTSLTSFCMIAQPLLMAPEKCIGDTLVNRGVEASKLCSTPVEMRMLSSAAGGLMSTGTASIMIRAIFPPPLFSWSLGEETKERTDRTSFNQLALPCWRKVIQTKSRPTLVFDHGRY